MINFVRHLSESEDINMQIRLKNCLHGFLQFSASFAIADSDGRDIMSYAIMTNNSGLVDFLITNKNEGHLNPANVDLGGKTATHLVVNPCQYGSFENIHILERLPIAGYDLNAYDKQGKTPMDYAKE